MGRKKHTQFAFFPTKSNRVAASSFVRREFERLQAAQHQRPQLIALDGQRRHWWFEGKFYSETEGLSDEAIIALVRERERKVARKVDRALMFGDSGSAAAAPKRQPISDDVKALVWQRDQGRCTNCGSNENLEFDHIIPLAMNGSNTARNLQLLCENCNRAKGGHLA